MELDPDILSRFLSQGEWKAGANENLKLRERLNYDFAAEIVTEYKSDPSSRTHQANLGLLVLALAVAQWGMRDVPPGLADPEDDAWQGPPDGRGKHLMSITAGGVGLPHMDKGYLADFLFHFRPKVDPEEKMRTIATTVQDLRGKGTFAKLKRAKNTAKGAIAWTEFVETSRLALGSFEGQRWVLERWLTRYWAPSLKSAQDDGRSVREAMVNARIRNSSSETAECAHRKAKAKADPIKAQLEAYVSGCPGSESDRWRRWGYMKRPVVLFDAL